MEETASTHCYCFNNSLAMCPRPTSVWFSMTLCFHLFIVLSFLILLSTYSSHYSLSYFLLLSLFLTKGNVTFSCSESSSVAVTFLSSSGSFLALPADYLTEGLTVRLQFRTWNQEGLLFSVPLSHDPDPSNMLLQLSQTRLLLSISGGPQNSAQVFSGMICRSNNISFVNTFLDIVYWLSVDADDYVIHLSQLSFWGWADCLVMPVLFVFQVRIWVMDSGIP